jgi:hypothetical protein
MPHDPTNYNKIIANNLLPQQYTTKLMLGICNVRDLTFILLKPKSFLQFSLGSDGRD